MSDPRPVAITLGDPCGIGPEIILKACAAGLPAPVRVIGDVGVLQRQAQRLGLPMDFPVESLTRLPEDLPLGQVDARAGDAAVTYVKAAAQQALRGEVRAIVTAPLSKEAMHLAGHPWPGHTELLAELAGGVPVRMMLANPTLRTVLVSIHVPLRQAIDSLSREGILETLRITDASLRRAGLPAPRLAVAGLNPHAGENGAFGREELDIIAPAILAAREIGIDARGPYPPDTVFMRARGFAEFDAVIAMYHDQGLIPVKYLGIEDGVNVTLGLPFVRTSPDHGTAFDIAGQGIAQGDSLRAAFFEALRLSGA